MTVSGRTPGWAEGWRTATLLGISLAFTAAGVLAAVRARTGEDVVVGSACAGMFGSGAAFVALQRWFGATATPAELPVTRMYLGADGVQRLERLSLMPARRTLVLLPLAIVMFAACGIVCFELGPPLVAPILAASAWIFAGFGVVTFAVGLQRKPAITFEAEGLTLHVRFGADVRVPWTELEAAYIALAQSQSFVCIVPSDLARVLRNRPPYSRRLAQLNVRLVGAPLTLPNTTAYTPTQLLALTLRYANACYDRSI